MNDWQRWFLGKLLDTYGPDIIDRIIAEIRSELREFTQETDTDLDNRILRMLERALQ